MFLVLPGFAVNIWLQSAWAFTTKVPVLQNRASIVMIHLLPVIFNGATSRGPFEHTAYDFGHMFCYCKMGN